MVENRLTPELVSEGAMLLEKLDSLGMSPVAALWCYMPERSRWQLLLADTRVGTKGPRAVYRVLLKALNVLGDQITHLSLEDISAVRPDEPLIKALAQAVRLTRRKSGSHVSAKVAEGTIIDDAYIYRMRRPAA